MPHLGRDGSCSGAVPDEQYPLPVEPVGLADVEAGQVALVAPLRLGQQLRGLGGLGLGLGVGGGVGLGLGLVLGLGLGLGLVLGLGLGLGLGIGLVLGCVEKMDEIM